MNHTAGRPGHDQGHTTTDARLLVGIDISKTRYEVLLAVPSKAHRRRMTVLNTAGAYSVVIVFVLAAVIVIVAIAMLLIVVIIVIVTAGFLVAIVVPGLLSDR